jgi:hypothetical protein
MKKLAFVMLVLVACGKGGNKTSAEDCKQVGLAVEKFWATEEAKATDEKLKAHAREMGPLAAKRLARHCQEDGWSKEAIACATNAAELKSCTDKLTKEQQDKLAASAPKIEVPMPASEPPPTPTEQAPPGSGSAPAGSGSN